MAERPAVKVQRMGRDKLALFLPNREAIKAFEHLIGDVAGVLPDAALANAVATEAAAAAAAAAQADADAALAAIAALTEGHAIEYEGAALPQRAILNFTGSSVTVSDVAGKTTVAVAGGAGASWVEVEIDFGPTPVYGAEFTITDAAITSASKVQLLPCGKAATGRTADDWAWDGAAFAANPGTGSATCYAQFLPGPIVGRRKVQYSVGA